MKSVVENSAIEQGSSPGRDAWHRLQKNRLALAGGIMLIVLAVLFSGALLEGGSTNGMRSAVADVVEFACAVGVAFVAYGWRRRAGAGRLSSAIGALGALAASYALALALLFTLTRG